jgi:transposase
VAQLEFLCRYPWWLSRKGRSVRAVQWNSGMAQSFIDCDREQAFLMPPSLRDWLPDDHLAWFVIETVEQLDLAAFYASYRADGHGRAAYEPSMMVSLLMFAYSTNERSSCGIERHYRQDIAYRVITGNRVPDHATVGTVHRVTSSRWPSCSVRS